MNRVLGKLSVVGLGPGDRGLTAPRAIEALRAADLVIGYRGYLEHIGDLIAGKDVSAQELGEERERVEAAIEAARAGRRVALVSSGDPGIYGMASLVVELVGDDRSIELEIIPGVTAACAASSLLGSPLGHDFAVISLSDLMTPWATIESRLDAAGRGDFAVALYNPASARRTWQLERAQKTLLCWRSPHTPVGLVERAYRAGESAVITTLGELDCSRVDMFSTVIVGNSRTRVTGGRLVTPRGYGDADSGFGVPVGVHGSGAPTSARDVMPAQVESDADAMAASDAILAASFGIVESELVGHSFGRDEFDVVRRMIHATADFDFARSVRFHSRAIDDGVAALRAGATIVTDVEMLRAGIRRDLLRRVGASTACLLNEPAAAALANAQTITRSAAGICLAAERFREPIVAIGSAPTALDETLRLAQLDIWRPRLVIGMPVGFVGVEEAKRRLPELATIPFITSLGRKGGTAVTAAAVNALLELAVRGM